MYCSNGSSSMATLLQQKNCMKTLTNGGGAGSSGQATAARVLLPHEMVSIPQSSPAVAAAAHSTIGGSLQPTQSTTIQHPHQFNNYLYYNPIHSSNDINTAAALYRQPSTSSSAATVIHQSIHQQNIPITSSSAAANNIHPATIPTTSTNSEYGGGHLLAMTMAQSTIITKEEIEIVDQNSATEQNIADAEEQEPEPEIDIVINNVVCSFSVRCHLNLREIALNGINVEFRRENGMVTMKLRRPYTTASIWSSGRITCTGATSEDQAKVAARRYARCLQKLGFSVKFNNFRVVNVLGTCSMPWAIRIVNFSEKYKKDASYEPELHPGVTYKLKNPRATLKIFSTGSITVTASSVANVQAAIEHIFPLVYEFRKKRAPAEIKDKDKDKGVTVKRKYPFGHSTNDPIEDNMFVSDPEDLGEEIENDL